MHQDQTRLSNAAQPDARAQRREEISLDATVQYRGLLITAAVMNITEHGLMGIARMPLEAPGEILIAQDELGELRAELVWSRGWQFGARFETPLDRGLLQAVLLQCGKCLSDAWIEQARPASAAPPSPAPRRSAMSRRLRFALGDVALAVLAVPLLLTALLAASVDARTERTES